MEFTTHLYKTVLLAIPMVIARAGLLVMVAVDTAMVGHYGTTPLAHYDLIYSVCVTCDHCASILFSTQQADAHSPLSDRYENTLTAHKRQLVGFQIPPPDKDVLKWSFIGQPIYDTWFMAATNLQELVSKIEPQLRTLAGLVLKAAAGAMGTVFIFVASVLIAGFLLARYRNAQDLIKRIAIKIDPSRGQDLIEVATQTIRSVAQGVIGVALIQGLLATLGMVIIGIPGAPLWGLAVLVVAVVQLPPMLILGVVSVYVFYMMIYGYISYHTNYNYIVQSLINYSLLHFIIYSHYFSILLLILYYP